jgi:hypothetical protein
MGPKRCTETSVNKYVMCLAFGHHNEKYVEDPDGLSQKRDGAVAMVAK